MTRDQVRADVAALLDIPASEIADEDNLLDHGLDSIRVMTLIETWQSRGSTVAFMDLAETPTITHWTTLLH